jgi:hypothetical protein
MPDQRHFRAFARRTLALPGALGDENGTARAVVVVNLGLGGACVEAQEDGALDSLSPGRMVTLEVAPSGLWDPLHLTARVAWVSPASVRAARAGIAFQLSGHHLPSGLIELLGSFR